MGLQQARSYEEYQLQMKRNYMPNEEELTCQMKSSGAVEAFTEGR